ncbi:hypothetical protein NE237_020872 [Protea cynaroides]|uniref:Uncharacterized protein n=1 Tax=Protea cynaroides TaxID=273540 RepID=A0A9Q0K2Z8_9MAGN|nr:hypothetical protein NE237_020872 [Protea cynaroides]
MAEISGAVRTNQPMNHTLQSLHAAFDPKAFLLSCKNSTPISTSDSETMAESTAALQQNNQPRNQTLQPPFLFSRNSTSISIGNLNSAAMSESPTAQPAKTHHSGHPLESLFADLDPNASSLTQSSTSPLIKPLEFTVADFSVERGPRYGAYSELRESKLRRKHNMMIKQQHSDEPESTVTPPKKRVTFQGPVASCARKGTSVVTQSVPDFSAFLRKENRRPPSSTLPSMLEMTPPLPSSKTSKLMSVSLKQGRSKSAYAGEKKGGGIMMRNSYASVEELKGLSSAAASAIHGESRGEKINRGINRSVLGHRQY